ncbi:DUF4347 domain-containing protein [Candidatus Bipolaricaulota bacterium]
MSKLRITVVEEASTADRYNWWSAALRSGEIQATSVEDMVDKILARLGEDGRIHRLILIGHGSSGNLSMGDGKGHEQGKHIGIGNQAEWTDELDRLKGRFCDNALLTLRGCKTGAKQAGADLVELLADMLGVRVRAPRGTINPLWVGGEWTKAPKV